MGMVDSNLRCLAVDHEVCRNVRSRLCALSDGCIHGCGKNATYVLPCLEIEMHHRKAEAVGISTRHVVKVAVKHLRRLRIM